MPALYTQADAAEWDARAERLAAEVMPDEPGRLAEALHATVVARVLRIGGTYDPATNTFTMSPPCPRG